LRRRADHAAAHPSASSANASSGCACIRQALLAAITAAEQSGAVSIERAD
jgi:hypothetical protein